MTSFTQEDVVRVAEGLTKAACEAILNARDDGDGGFFLSGHSAAPQSIYDANLGFIVWRGLMLNETGLAVRNHILEQAHD